MFMAWAVALSTSLWPAWPHERATEYRAGDARPTDEMRFTVSYERERSAAHGAADVTFLVEADDAEAAETAAADLYTTAYGRSPADDLAELISIRLSP